MRPARSVARRAASSTASRDSCPATTGTRIERYSSASAAPSGTGARDVTRSGHAQAAPVEQVEDEAGREPGKTRVARRRVLDHDDEPGERRCRARRRSRTAASRSPRMRRFGRARHSSSSSRRLARAARSRRACAIVNESIAPNAYIRPRKSTWPESRKSVGPMPAKTISASHGVFSFGCSRRKTSGSCR